MECALPAEVVQGVERTLEITPVPNTAPWISGIVQAWGGIVSVVDLQMFFGLEPQTLTPRSRLVVVARGDLTVGCWSTRSSRCAPLAKASPAISIRAPRQTGRSLMRWADCGLAIGIVVVLDADKVVLSQKMRRYRAE